MKLNLFKYLWVGSLCSLLLVGCDDDDEYDVLQVDAPVLVSSNPANNATNVSKDLTEVTLTFDKNIYFASSNASQVTLNGSPVSKALVYGASPTLTVSVALELGTTYTLSVPAGLITGPNQMEVGAVSLTFSTEASSIAANPCNASATDAAKALYADMVNNYGSKVYSATMANVNWNYDNAKKVHEWTGKYPAINCFDYAHLSYSAAGGWIDYDDITPAREWHNLGGIVAAMWHWNVPVSQEVAAAGTVESYAFYSENNGFSASNALTQGTWENTFLMADLAKMAQKLLLLQDAGIPVLWRPLHEAAGAWFWWGAEGASTYVSLWRTMYDYFQSAGVNNLIWVWTSEGGKDADWYPGDAYVDIIGVDIYTSESMTAVQEIFASLTEQHPNKMITLSECDDDYLISEQWSAGALWSWFMPWYDDENTTYSTEAWWQDVMSQSYVISISE